jgi:hypothetical protein
MTIVCRGSIRSGREFVCKSLLALTLSVAANTVLAGPVTKYQETLNFGTASDVAHSNATTFVESNQSDSQFSTRSVEFASQPSPSIRVQTEAYNAIGTMISDAQASLVYDVGVTGRAFTWVPIVVQGRYAFAAPDLNLNPPRFNIENSTSVRLIMGDLGEFSTGFDYTCIRQVCTQKIFTEDHSQFLVHPILEAYDAFEGTFEGIINVLTDADGNATKTVHMFASATAKVAFEPVLIDKAGAFLDPQFHIDPDWLALNPGAFLSFPDGVGNSLPSISSVPEPASWLLMLSGIGLSIGFARRRYSLALPDSRS